MRRRRGAALSLAALGLTLAVAALAAAPAGAAFPGRDGKLVLAYGSFSESEDPPYPSRSEAAIQAVEPRGGIPVTLRSCVQETGKPDVGDCTIGYHSPTVSPNGRLVAFATGTQLALMRIDGSRLRLLPAHSDEDGEPAFSPSGRRLVFSAGGVVTVQHPPPRGLWTSDLAGGQARQVSARGTAPSWSTRNWIAFVRKDGIYRVRPDGRGLRRLVHRARCSDVDWSPHGTQLAFTCRTKHLGGRLYVSDGAGRHVRRVVVRYASPEGVVWSPSGKRLAITAFESPLQTVRLDGSHEIDLGSGGSGANYGAGVGGAGWQPLR